MCLSVDTRDDMANVNFQVQRVMLMRGKSTAPRRPPRMAIIGPPGAGSSTQAQKIADLYGLIYVSTKQLLLD
jgi:ABC-type iron transport system FetAB ATPase subunit